MLSSIVLLNCNGLIGRRRKILRLILVLYYKLPESYRGCWMEPFPVLHTGPIRTNSITSETGRNPRECLGWHGSCLLRIVTKYLSWGSWWLVSIVNCNPSSSSYGTKGFYLLCRKPFGSQWTGDIAYSCPWLSFSSSDILCALLSSLSWGQRGQLSCRKSTTYPWILFSCQEYLRVALSLCWGFLAGKARRA